MSSLIKIRQTLSLCLTQNKTITKSIIPIIIWSLSCKQKHETMYTNNNTINVAQGNASDNLCFIYPNNNIHNKIQHKPISIDNLLPSLYLHINSLSFYPTSLLTCLLCIHNQHCDHNRNIGKRPLPIPSPYTYPKTYHNLRVYLLV